MSSAESYALALNSVTQKRCEQVAVDLDEWVGATKQVGIDVECSSDEDSDVDMFDSEFIDFHTYVRDFFVATFGLLALSEAYHFFCAIRPCVSFVVVEEDDIEPNQVDIL